MSDSKDDRDMQRKRKRRRRVVSGAQGSQESTRSKSGFIARTTKTFRTIDGYHNKSQVDMVGAPPSILLSQRHVLVTTSEDKGSNIVRILMLPAAANAVETKILRSDVGVLDGFKYRAFAYDEFEKIRRWRKFSPTNAVYLKSSRNNGEEEKIEIERSDSNFLVEDRNLPMSRVVEFYLHGGQHRFHVVFYLGGERTLRSVLDLVVQNITTIGFTQELFVGRQLSEKPSDDSVTYVSAKRLPFGLSIKKTLEFARSEWPHVTGGGDTTEMRPTSTSRTEPLKTLALIHNISFDQVENYVASFFVVENDIEDRYTQEQTNPGSVTSNDDAMRFAAAIAASLDGFAASGKFTESEVYAVIMRAVRSWLNRDGLTLDEKPTPTHLNIRIMTSRQFQDLKVLVQFAPWLVWWMQGHHPEQGGLRFEATAAAVADALILARPTRVYRSTDGSTYAAERVNPRQMQSVCHIKDKVAISQKEWDLTSELATLAWSDTSVLSNQNLVGLGAKLRDSIRHRRSEFSPQDIVVRWDISEEHANIVYVNKTKAISEIVMGETKIVLGEFCDEDSGRDSWCSTPVEVKSTFSAVLNGTTMLNLKTPAPAPILPLTEILARERTPLFMGRDLELQRILDQAHPDLSVRVPILIWGNRRAGKTTMAWQALDKAQEQGLIKTKVFFDVYQVVAGRPDEEVEEAIVKKIYKELDKTGDFVLPEPKGDLLEFLDTLDKTLEGNTIGILLDEFDTLFWRDPQSPIYRLVRRMSGISYENIVLIGTTQRFSAKEAVLKDWLMIQCISSLNWQDALGFFSGNLLEPEPELVLNRLTVLPQQISEAVIPNIGFRPYLWSKTYSKLSGALKQKRLKGYGSAVATHKEVITAIEKVVEMEPMFVLPLAPTKGVPRWDILREDLFTLEEKKLLVAILENPTGTISRQRVAEIGGYTALAELVEREMVETTLDDPSIYKMSLPAMENHLRENIIKLYAVIEQDS